MRYFMVFFSMLAWAQAPPSKDIYLVHLVGESIDVGSLINVTTRSGYDNQPEFMDDNTIYFTSIRGERNADIFAYDLKTKKTKQITNTDEAEYSPTPIPGSEKFSVVRVETDGTQRLWSFPIGGGEPEVLLPAVKGIGYHTWLDERHLGLFVLGEPHNLQIGFVQRNMAEKLHDDIGRGLKVIPGTKSISFIQRHSDTDWSIAKIDSEKQMETIIKTLPEAQDFCWSPDGSIWMGQGSKLFKFKPGQDKEWQEVADFKEQGLDGITRIAISPNGKTLALTAND